MVPCSGGSHWKRHTVARGEQEEVRLGSDEALVVMQARGDGGLADQGEKQRWRERGEAVSGWHTVSVKGQNVSGVLGFSRSSHRHCVHERNMFWGQGRLFLVMDCKGERSQVSGLIQGWRTVPLLSGKGWGGTGLGEKSTRQTAVSHSNRDV
ncbi:hypothetical protein Cadr_000026300 [Camelus dromedarius]|uniref:Uncharacterized protein n=1 Tax=Camelus dromedarius TaxID=9838 RepID=A0A5N4CDT0_CAMDR|nr:hypothetical protein Cadr_000026300 [Camelus dromedarius]